MKCICMVSDFFYPNMGGVESHLFQLAQCLMELGHKVIIVTHFYGDRRGVRWMTNFLKVYYLPILPFYNKSVLPTIVCSLPYLRHIFLKEGVTVVHGHSAFSTLANEALFAASLLDIPSVFTDHSLFGFSDASAIVTNTFLQYSLVNTTHTICVSHTGKENTVLRSKVPPGNVSVIPNAVDSVMFEPGPKSGREGVEEVVTVVIGSRLVYRKGIDLVAAIVPNICSKKFGKNGKVRVDFIVAGDGPKRIVLEEMIENHYLQSRVIMLGELQHSQVRDQLLIKGDIFLNTSLTEAFCMAIVEAVSCGLVVVSTAVGGIPEVLPPKFIYFVEPTVASIVAGLSRAVEDVVEDKRPDPRECNEFVKNAYNWRDVARRTRDVYTNICRRPAPTLAKKVRNLWECGPIAGPLVAMLYLFCHYFLLVLDWFRPIK